MKHALLALLALQQAPRESYSLCVVPIAFSDRDFGATPLQKLFFTDVAAWYTKASGGKFTLRGRVFAPVRLGVERAKFKDGDLGAALSAFLAREGEGTLAAYDGVAFVAAGGLGARGTPLWPRQETVRSGDRSVECVLLAEEAGDRAVGIAAHETMHLLGLADKYDDEKSSVGKACILGTGYDALDPAPPCADCREKLGWTTATPLDPRRTEAIVMAPDMTRSLKIAVNADGSEALLLEARDRLYVWHLGGGKKIELVATYPSVSSDRLTPLSEPAFRGRSAGARQVWITGIRLEAGKFHFTLGPDAPLTPAEEQRRARQGKRLAD